MSSTKKIKKSYSNFYSQPYSRLNSKIKLYGTIPQNVGQLKRLESLILNRNHFVGTIPPSLTRSDLNLINVDLSGNDLSGTIPTGISNIRYLIDFKVNGEKIKMLNV